MDSNITNLTLTVWRNDSVNSSSDVTIFVDNFKWYESRNIKIFLYSVIFMLAVIGNSLVILTLAKNQRMRTITNVFLLNLAISDLLLGVLCMPFTLVGTLLRDFIFGKVMCKFLPYLQATSVAVSAYTLVAISVERYYAICHPLRSRRWQTLSHAYKLIVLIWISSLLCMIPIATFSELIPTSKGHHKCREEWSLTYYEKIYNIFLDVILLILPLFVLGVTYFLITRTLWYGMRTEVSSNYTGNGAIEIHMSSRKTSTAKYSMKRICSPAQEFMNCHQLRTNPLQASSRSTGSTQSKNTPELRRTNAEKSLANKKRVVKMLCAVVLEFFVCWTPLYIVNTVALYNPLAVYTGLGYTAISFFQLLAYTSSCCNPITYCFMNNGFRKSFLNLFSCFKIKVYRDGSNVSLPDSRSTTSNRWNYRYSTRYSEPL